MVSTCIPFPTNTNREEVKIAIAQRTTVDKTLHSPTLTVRKCSICAVFIAKTQKS